MDQEKRRAKQDQADALVSNVARRISRARGRRIEQALAGLLERGCATTIGGGERRRCTWFSCDGGASHRRAIRGTDYRSEACAACAAAICSFLDRRNSHRGSALASFTLAKTYDHIILSKWGTYGTRGDAAKARELYAKAHAGGIHEAKDRSEALDQ